MNWLLWGILAGAGALIPMVDDDSSGVDWFQFQLLIQPIFALGVVAGAVFA